MDKPALRRDRLERVRALPPEARAAASRAIVAILERDAAFLSARRIFTFSALGSEPDLAALVRRHPGKRWCYPRMEGTEHLIFHEVSSVDELRPGPLGFLQPDPGQHPEIPCGLADLVLVPGVAFDSRKGARLGRGKGHYDRFLEAAGQAAPPATVGVCFSVQLAALEPEDHDAPMDRILTERGWSP